MTSERPLLLVGGGKMGGAMVQGWLARGTAAASIHVVDPSADNRQPLADRGVNAVAGIDDLPDGLDPEVVILAVKPQVISEVAPPYARFAAPGTVFLSIAAGKTLGFFGQILGDSAAVVRSIPNTPSAVGRGMTVACANANVTDAQKDSCDALLRGIGETGWVEDESLIDVVTAVAGSGPAYVFYLIECLAEAGMENGLPEDLARKCAGQMVAGAGELYRQSGEPAEQLRRNVTSPKGTTEAALTVLMAADGLRPLIGRTVEAAARRSRELAG